MQYPPNTLILHKGEIHNLFYGADSSKPSKIFARNLDTKATVEFPSTTITEFSPVDWHAAALVKLLPVHVFGAQHSATAGASGADPEIFGFTSAGKVVPAWEYLQPPAHGRTTYWDGVQAEFTPSAGSCHEALTDRVRTLLMSVHAQLRAKHPDASLIPQDVVKLDKKLLVEGEEAHLKLGCSASFNAYEIPAIEVGDYRALPYRFAGAHFHHSFAAAVGYGFTIPEWFPTGTVVMMDKVAGLLLTALGRDLENPLRRKYYGRPGEFRVPNKSQLHLEYRTPSNFVLWSPGIYNFAADITRIAYRMGLYADGSKYPLPDVQQIIMESDADAACKVIKNEHAFFAKVLNTVYMDPAVTKATFSALAQGLKAFASVDKTSIADAWQFGADKYDMYNDGHKRGWRQFALQS